MPTIYADSNAPGGGDGSEALPYNTISGGTLGSNDWMLAAGSVFAMGATALTSGNNATVRKWGAGADPEFTFTGEGFSSATATGTVLLEDIKLTRLGSRGGTGANFTQMSGASANATVRRCTITNWTACVQGDRCRKLTVEDSTLSGTSSTYGIRGRAHATVNCEGWVIVRNTFVCGIDMELYVSNSDCSLGSYNNLVVEDNISNGPAGCGTSLLIRGAMNATDYSARAYITGAGSGGGVLQRDDGSSTGQNTASASPVWPAWQAGTVLFLAGWGDIANFGTVTVVSGGGTRAVTVTNLSATLVNEGNGIGKGCAVIDPARSFKAPTIRRNVIRNRGETPAFIDNFRGGVVEANEFYDTVNIGTVAAAIEAFGCYRTIARGNIVDGISGTVGVDAMGLFWDGACVECIGIDNVFRNIRPTTAAANAGAAMATFFALNCQFINNTAEDCTLGFWAGGIATRGLAGNNTITGCDIGVSINSQPAAGALTVRSNAISLCAQGIRDSSSAYVLGNAWGGNTVDNAFGTLAAKDADAQPLGEVFSLDAPPVRQVGAHPRAALQVE